MLDLFNFYCLLLIFVEKKLNFFNDFYKILLKKKMLKKKNKIYFKIYFLLNLDIILNAFNC